MRAQALKAQTILDMAHRPSGFRQIDHRRGAGGAARFARDTRGGTGIGRSALEICMARDPKGIYRTAKAGQAATVPGLQEPYEPPQSPDLVVRGENPEEDARRIVEILVAKRYLR
jgi:Adenylylsulphate kinase